MAPLPKRLADGRVLRWYHSPFTLQDGKFEIEVNEHGKVKILENHNDTEVSEVNVSAALVFKISNMLNNTRKYKYINREDIPKEVTDD